VPTVSIAARRAIANAFNNQTAKMSLEEISTLFGDPVEGLTEKQVEIAAPIDGGKKNTRVEDVVIEEHENVAE